ncbi:MAG: DUF4339 domain-containing protein [Parachlamydiaceae bacterium]|nr:DUF4339 domain-containing protein [Parachlamydiaceae bacterium]
MPTSDPNSNLLISFIILLIIAGLTSYYAEQKGRSPAAWFVIGILIGFFAPLILFFLPNLKKDETNEASMKVYTPPVSGNSTPPAPPPRLEDENKLWYYLDQNHQQYGPVSIFALKELWDTGRLELTSYVWTEGMDKWEKVDNLPELKVALGKVQI